MTDVRYRAEFPGTTEGEALKNARDAEQGLPFELIQSTIELIRFWDSEMWREAGEDDKNDLKERGWQWVATLKATGKV